MTPPEPAMKRGISVLNIEAGRLRMKADNARRQSAVASNPETTPRCPFTGVRCAQQCDERCEIVRDYEGEQAGR
jgi:hypothetical protein